MYVLCIFAQGAHRTTTNIESVQDGGERKKEEENRIEFQAYAKSYKMYVYLGKCLAATVRRSYRKYSWTTKREKKNKEMQHLLFHP
jgi:nickel-dependent lactate racemase